MTAINAPMATRTISATQTVLWLLAFAAVLYLVTLEQGVLTSGAPVLHEAFHDARHLLGIPCH